MGPLTETRDNWFGDSCIGGYSWCVELGIGGFEPGVGPLEFNTCEAFVGVDCTDGTWRLAIQVGVDRQSACGF